MQSLEKPENFRSPLSRHSQRPPTRGPEPGATHVHLVEAGGALWKEREAEGGRRGGVEKLCGLVVLLIPCPTSIIILVLYFME